MNITFSSISGDQSQALHAAATSTLKNWAIPRLLIYKTTCYVNCNQALAACQILSQHSVTFMPIWSSSSTYFQLQWSLNGGVKRTTKILQSSVEKRLHSESLRVTCPLYYSEMRLIWMWIIRTWAINLSAWTVFEKALERKSCKNVKINKI